MAFQVVIGSFFVLLALAVTEQQEQSCGIENGGGQSRIVNGEDVDPYNQYPWTLRLTGTSLFGFGWSCTAVLLNPRTALTAAHCIRSFARHTIHYGHADKNQQKSVRVSRAIQHPNYSTETWRKTGGPKQGRYNIPINDIGLLFLSSSITENEDARRACMPNCKEDYAGSNGEASGWGKLSDDRNESPIWLQRVTLRIGSFEECMENYEPRRSNYRYPEMFCTPYQDGKSTCRGDSGGPLTHQCQPGVHEVLGVTSWGVHCDTTESFFTNVTHYLPWIRETMQRNGQ